MKKQPPLEPPKHKRKTTLGKPPKATAFRHNHTGKSVLAPPPPKPGPPETPSEPLAGERKPST
jgi:hypothetical protein